MGSKRKWRHSLRRQYEEFPNRFWIITFVLALGILALALQAPQVVQMIQAITVAGK